MLTFPHFENSIKNLRLIFRSINKTLFVCFKLLPKILRSDCPVTSQTECITPQYCSTFCFPVPGKRLPADMSVLMCLKTHVIVPRRTTAIPSPTSCFVWTHKATEVAPYPQACTQRHWQRCSEMRRTAMETAHFPNTWGNRKHL